MNQPIRYFAASVPRFLRQTRLSYLPLNTLVGSRVTQDASGTSLIFDIIMLPELHFQRMRMNVGLQHVAAPANTMGGNLQPGFVLSDAKQVVVPEGEPNPEAYAREYFIQAFGLVEAAPPAQ